MACFSRTFGAEEVPHYPQELMAAVAQLKQAEAVARDPAKKKGAAAVPEAAQAAETAAQELAAAQAEVREI